MQQTAGDLEATLHASGVEAGLLARPIRQPDHVEQRVHAPFDLGPVQPVQDGVEAQVLLAGEVVVERQLLEHEPDARTNLVPGPHHVVAGDPGNAPAGMQERAQDGDRGRLAGAVGPEEPEQLTRLDRERDAVDGREVPEPLDEAVDLDRPVRPVCRNHNGSGYRPPDRPPPSVIYFVGSRTLSHAPGDPVGSGAQRRAAGLEQLGFGRRRLRVLQSGVHPGSGTGSARARGSPALFGMQIWGSSAAGGGAGGCLSTRCERCPGDPVHRPDKCLYHPIRS